MRIYVLGALLPFRRGPILSEDLLRRLIAVCFLE
jgi:hypothetical protein